MGANVLKFLNKAVLLSAATMLLGMGFSSAAMAQNLGCQATGTYGASGIYGPNGIYSYMITNQGYFKCSVYSPNNTADQNSSVVTSTAVLKTAAVQAAGLVANRVSSAMNGGGAGVAMASNGFSASTGANGGDGHTRYGAWVSGSYSDIEDENTSTAYDGNVYTVMGGIDMKVARATILGVSVGYENIDVDTAYNQSVATGEDGSLEGDGWTVAPYIGVALSPNANANLTVGYTRVSYDTARFDPAVANRITGSTDADRYFVSGAVNGSHMFDDHWHLLGGGTVFYATEDKDSFTETDKVTGATIAQGSQTTDFGQVVIDARLGYMMKGFEPYALAAAEFDFSKDEAPVASSQTKSSIDDGDFGARFGGGLNLNLGPNVSGQVEAYTVEFREDYNEVTVTGGLRVNF